MTLGDRVAVMKEGLLQQVAPPMELYRRPGNRFVAGFIGSPAMNLFDGAVERSESGWRFSGSGFVTPSPVPVDAASGGAVTLGIRPPDVRVAADDRTAGVSSDGGGIRAHVSVVEPIGSTQIVHFTLDDAEGPSLIAVVPAELDLEEDAAVVVGFPPGAIHLFRSEDGARLDTRPAR